MDIIFDIETKESFQDVGGRGNVERLTVSVLVYCRADTDAFVVLEEGDLDQFGAVLKEDGVRLIGYNITGFDIPVLKKYLGGGILQVSTLDMMDDVTDAIGRRLPLNALLEGTLDVHKTGDGLDAIMWWQAGEVEKVKQYCKDDVRLTRDLFNYGKEHGEVFYTAQVGSSRYHVPVSWGGAGSAQRFDSVLGQAHQAQLCVAVTYRTDDGVHEGILEPRHLDDVSVEGRLRETGEMVSIAKRAITKARLVMQRF